MPKDNPFVHLTYYRAYSSEGSIMGGPRALLKLSRFKFTFPE